jgi:hypothetical protein
LTLDRQFAHRVHSFPLFPVVYLAVIFAAGCGASNSSPSPVGNTSVILLLTSTANDKLEDFLVTIASVSVTNEEGKAVTLYSNNTNAGIAGLDVPAEFMHLNGVTEPLVTVSVPRGTYTSASVIAGYCSITDIWADSSGGIHDETEAETLCAQGTGNSTVNLTSPIIVDGSAMALSLNLQVSQSYTLSGTGTSATYTISPVFTFSAIPISSQPTNDENGKITGIDAQITSTNETGNSFVAQTADGISLTISSNSSTAYQGVPGFSAIATGMLVNLDTAIQADASLLATRIEVDDPTAAVGVIGPLMSPGEQTDEFTLAWLEGVGCVNSTSTLCGSVFQYDGNTVFGVSGQFSNLQNLPFTATFNNSNMLSGQMLSVYSPTALNQQSIQNAAIILLTPQTINATVTSISNTNGLAVYSVELAPYALIPTLQEQAGNPHPVINSPTSLVVYVDSNTRRLNSGPISVGSFLRFRGVIFYDNGTLRMDCQQINDGVAE